jgi:hypothetical protein
VFVTQNVCLYHGLYRDRLGLRAVSLAETLAELACAPDLRRAVCADPAVRPGLTP